MRKLPEDWLECIQKGDFLALADKTKEPPDLDTKVFFALWHSRALRALGEGEKANAALIAAANDKFAATVDEIAEMAEELAQCAYYEAAAEFALKLDKLQAPQASYVWTILWREREDWLKFQEAIKKLEMHGEPWVSLARIQSSWALMRQGRLKAAEALIKPLSEENHLGVRKLLARLDLVAGRWQEASVKCEIIFQAQPLDWESPALLAGALIPLASDLKSESASKRIDELFTLSLKRQPRQPETLLNRARWRLMHGQVRDAEQDCDEALKLKPWFDAPVLMWVEQSINSRDYSKAENLLERARRVLDTPKRAGAALDVLRLKGSKNEIVIAAAEKLRRSFPIDAIALRTAGVALQAAKRLDDAAVCYADALAINPDDTATSNNLALLYKERGDLDEAIRMWRRITDDPNETIKVNYALTLLDRGDRLEAERIFSEILSKSPRNPAALRGMAEIAFAEGEDERAWSMASAALQVDKNNPYAWTTAAGVLIRREGEKAAAQLLIEGESHAKPVLTVRKALFQRWRNLLSYEELHRKVMAWTEAEPTEAEYWLMAADAAFDINDFNQCEGMLKEAMQHDAGKGAEALVKFYLSRDRQGAARRIAEQFVRDEPHTLKYYGLLAEVLYRQERFEEAIDTVNLGLKREPTRLSLVRLKVGFFLAKEQYDQAIEAAKSLFEIDPGSNQLSLWLGALTRANRFDEAVTIAKNGLAKFPDDQSIRLSYVRALLRAGKEDEALDELEKLYRDEPQNFNVIKRYTRLLVSKERLVEAIAILKNLAEASRYRPQIVTAISELMFQEGAREAAHQLVERSLEQSPEHLDLWRQKAKQEKLWECREQEVGTWQEILKRFPARLWAGWGIPDLVRLDLIEQMELSLNSWRKAESDNPAPWWAAFYVSKEMKKFGLALKHLNKIEQIRGTSAKIHGERAAILQETWRMGDAIESLKKGLELRPDGADFYEQLLNLYVKSGNFDDFDKTMSKLEHMLGDQRYYRYANFFFNINCHPTWSAAEVWRFYRDWYVRAIKPSLQTAKPHRNILGPNRRLRIGYVSPDFRRHAVAYFSEPLMVLHDKKQFELFAYAHLDANQEDEYTERFKTYFHHWIPTRGMNDEELEQKIRNDGIDILVDLAGHTSNNRLKVFLSRPAPVQASWIWGAGQTTGLPQVDYFLTDLASVPPDHDPYMAETVMRMSRPGLPFKPAHDVLDSMPLPCLRNGFVTFGVLARPLRTNRKTVELWAKILHQVPDSVLRFDHVPYAEADVQQRLISYFNEHGIGPERLQFKNTRPHWQVYQEIDLQLDPFPAGSGTTASEGLYMERLVVTLRSRPPMGLIAHGQLEAMGLDNLCTADTEDDYVEKTVALASDCQQLAELSAGLRERVKNSWLMDYSEYGREVAGMYRQMWHNWCARQEEAA